MKTFYFYTLFGLLSISDSLLATDTEKENSHPQNIAPLSPSKKLVVRNNSVTALQKEIKIPQQFNVGSLYAEVKGFEQALEQIKEESHVRVSPYTPFVTGKNYSVFLNSEANQLCCGMVPDINELMLLADYSEKAKGQTSSEIISFTQTFGELMATASTSLSLIFVNMENILMKRKPPKLLCNIY